LAPIDGRQLAGEVRGRTAAQPEEAIMKINWAVCSMTMAIGAATLGAGSMAMAKDPDPAAAMAAYEKAAAPGDQHKLLQKMVGKWDVAVKSWMAPGQPPMESKGTAEAKTILGDRFVEMKFNGTMMDKPFEGIGTTGYDNTKKKFVGTWIDSMSTGIMRTEGTADAAGKVITNQATSSDPMTGKEARLKIVEKWESDNKHTSEFFEKRGGKEMKTMEIVYTKK
jgi:hypothetical protein